MVDAVEAKAECGNHCGPGSASYCRKAMETGMASLGWQKETKYQRLRVAERVVVDCDV
jgi:hypothetical protein